MTKLHEKARRQPPQAAAPALSSPRPVTRGESTPQNCADIAHVDWLAFTVRPIGNIEPWISPFLNTCFGISTDNWKTTARGWCGYQHRIDLGKLGLLAYGGEHQKGTIHVELNAHACARAKDWAAIRAWGESTEAKISRIDLAHDDLTGQFININVVRAWYEAEGFHCSGRPPTPHLRDDLGTGKGKTFYVGERQHGKMARCYEKGKQLGDPLDPWFRIEVELRSRNRVIPWDIVTRPGCYFAGAYPCLEKFGSAPERIRTVQRALTISYDKMEHWVREAAGPALNVMCEAHEGDAAGVLARVIRNAVPKRLEGYTAAERRRARDRDE